VKIRHWSIMNQSGMHHLAQAVADGERRLGHDALVVDASDDGPWADPTVLDADVHCIHSRWRPGAQQAIRAQTGRDPKLVFYSHGIPEHLIELSVQEFLVKDIPEPQDLWAFTRYWLKEADAFVVFSPRQAVLYNTMLSRGQEVDLVPLGVDLTFWERGPEDAPRLRGTPSVWMSENQHRIKWALDMFFAWPLVARALPTVHLHAHFIPYDVQRFLVDIVNANGAAFNATVTQKFYPHDALRTFWKGCDFMLATTRYGDNTCLTMQAEAAGLKTISYPGNQYASFWVPEGDQRVIADQLTGILMGMIPPREDKLPVPDLTDMAASTLAIYDRILGNPTGSWKTPPPLPSILP
jgi:hypothetical protein